MRSPDAPPHWHESWTLRDRRADWRRRHGRSVPRARYAPGSRGGAESPARIFLARWRRHSKGIKAHRKYFYATQDSTTSIRGRVPAYVDHLSCANVPRPQEFNSPEHARCGDLCGIGNCLWASSVPALQSYKGTQKIFLCHTRLHYFDSASCAGLRGSFDLRERSKAAGVQFT